VIRHSEPHRVVDSSLVAHAYDRAARLFDRATDLDLALTRRWRRDLWSRSGVEGSQILEIGVGTGINFPFHAPGSFVTAIDVAQKMLDVARGHLARSPARVELELADVQALPFVDASFDSAIATFVFCCVPDPMLGLEEVLRVLRPGGRLLLLEHVLSSKRGVAAVMRALDPLIAHDSGEHIVRDTVGNVRRAGFVDVIARPVWLDVVQLIEARAPAATSEGAER
jgi:ubiquinone/menaquinone biosynthesis C-methylase UbiE